MQATGGSSPEEGTVGRPLGKHHAFSPMWFRSISKNRNPQSKFMPIEAAIAGTLRTVREGLRTTTRKKYY